MELAPLIVFAFNRLEALQNTIQSLLQNSEAQESELYLFVDGARPDRPSEAEKVKAVQEYVRGISGFKAVHYAFSEENKGLGNSIIQGVTQVIHSYGRVIVLEDDLILSKDFLSYMNKALEFYTDFSQVFSICGFGARVRKPKSYEYDMYFCVRSSSWGWGTWADRWDSVDWTLQEWNKYKKYRRAFNKWGGSDCWKMLDGWHEGRNKSWAIRFCFAQFLQDKVSLFPFISKVDNKGFNQNATNCPSYCRTKWFFVDSDNKDFIFPEDVRINERVYKDVMYYRSYLIRMKSLLINAYSKMVYRLFSQSNR